MKRISLVKAEKEFLKGIEIYYLGKGQNLKNKDIPKKITGSNFKVFCKFLEKSFNYGDRRKKSFKLYIK